MSLGQTVCSLRAQMMQRLLVVGLVVAVQVVASAKPKRRSFPTARVVFRRENNKKCFLDTENGVCDENEKEGFECKTWLPSECMGGEWNSIHLPKGSATTVKQLETQWQWSGMTTVVIQTADKKFLVRKLNKCNKNLLLYKKKYLVSPITDKLAEVVKEYVMNGWNVFLAVGGKKLMDKEGAVLDMHCEAKLDRGELFWCGGKIKDGEKLLESLAKKLGNLNELAKMHNRDKEFGFVALLPDTKIKGESIDVFLGRKKEEVKKLGLEFEPPAVFDSKKFPLPEIYRCAQSHYLEDP